MIFKGVKIVPPLPVMEGHKFSLAKCSILFMQNNILLPQIG